MEKQEEEEKKKKQEKAKVLNKNALPADLDLKGNELPLVLLTYYCVNYCGWP